MSWSSDLDSTCFALCCFYQCETNFECSHFKDLICTAVAVNVFNAYHLGFKLELSCDIKDRFGPERHFSKTVKIKRCFDCIGLECV